MSQYRQQEQQKPQRTLIPLQALATLIASLILGIFILIAAINVKSGMKALATAVNEQNFSSSFSAPSNLTVNGTAERKYLTQDEAAAYLNLTSAEISTAISNGEITDYIITADGYSISTAALDDYFDAKAYEIQIRKNSAE